MKTAVRRLLTLLAPLLLAFGAASAQNPATCTQNCPAPYVPNAFWTTQYGTAAANIVLSPTNFLACSSTSYALCFYSGPNAAPSTERSVCSKSTGVMWNDVASDGSVRVGACR